MTEFCAVSCRTLPNPRRRGRTPLALSVRLIKMRCAKLLPVATVSVCADRARGRRAASHRACRETDISVVKTDDAKAPIGETRAEDLRPRNHPRQRRRGPSQPASSPSRTRASARPPGANRAFQSASSRCVIGSRCGISQRAVARTLASPSRREMRRSCAPQFAPPVPLAREARLAMTKSII